MASEQHVHQPNCETGPKNIITVQEINSERAKAAIQVFMRWSKEAAAAGANERSEGSSSSKSNDENEIGLNLKNLKVN